MGARREGADRSWCGKRVRGKRVRGRCVRGKRVCGKRVRGKCAQLGRGRKFRLTSRLTSRLVVACLLLCAPCLYLSGVCLGASKFMPRHSMRYFVGLDAPCWRFFVAGVCFFVGGHVCGATFVGPRLWGHVCGAMFVGPCLWGGPASLSLSCLGSLLSSVTP